MNMPDWLQAIQQNQKTANRINNLLVALMMACLGGTIAQLGARLDPTWDGKYLIYVCFLISLEAVLTHHFSSAFYTHERIGFRIAEWVGFAVVLKLLPYLLHGFESFSADVQAWQGNLVTFFTPEYLALLAMSVLVWRLSGDFANDFEIMNAEITDISYEEGKLDNSRGEARQRLLDRALILGVLVALITVGTRLEIDALWADRPLEATTMLYLVAYFVLTLILLSQSQFAVLRGQWLWHKTPVSPNLAEKWLGYAGIFLLVLTALALLLPTSYTLGFLESLQTVLNFFWSLLIGIFSLITLPFRWLLNLLNPGSDVTAPSEPPAEQETIPQPLPDGTLPWLEVLKSVVFWAALIGIIGYTIWFYVRRTPRLAAFASRLRPFGWLSNLWAWLRRQVGGLSKAAGTAAASLRKSLNALRTRAVATRRGTRFNFKQATPRQQVMYFYLQLLEKAAARGLVRKPSQTPAQYEATLTASLAEVEPDVRGITEAFSEARYSRHEIPAEESGLVRQMWNRIMQAFRNRIRGRQEKTSKD